MYLRTIWWAVLLGLVLGGMLEHFVPKQYISQVLARRKRRTIFYAVGLGFLASACCHGILALSIQLYKKGASTPAVVAFLLASPWANLPLTLILIGFFGVVKSLYIIFAAVAVALTTGMIFQFLESKNGVDRNPNTLEYDSAFSIGEDFSRRASVYRLTGAQFISDVRGVMRGAWALGEMVLWWILIGMGLASLAGAYIPAHVFQQYMGPGVLGMTVTLGLATVLEVCSEGTAPLAFEIYRQTGALGNSFVFLMAGVATDYTEIGLLWHNVGRRTAIWLPIITVPQIILWGILANKIF
ncbi:MAG: permease [Candidatus Omnitrophota bacterium]|nr:permease [Candidatus Omnitrophota bacterium]MDZ4242974.1 permease [Candidatus Omnitrophota bacterium]